MNQRPFLVSFALTLVVFFLGAGLEWTLQQLQVHGVAALLDNGLAAMIVGALTYLSERRRQRALHARLLMIAEMNHHVRNALQPLTLTIGAMGGEAEVKMMREAVKRIDWALREVLPGNPKAA